MNEDLPLVSICCLTYNHELFIRQALEGFLFQETSFAFEILVHDDASTDKTASIVREYELKYPSIVKAIYQEENKYSQGVGVTRVYQFPRSKGKYIAMCEGDDYWTDPFKLQKQVDILEGDSSLSAVSHLTLAVGADGSVYEKQFYQYESEGDTLLRISDFLTSIPFHTSSFVFRSSVLKQDYINTVITRDHPLMIVLSMEGDILRLNETMSHYRKHAGGVSTSISAEMVYQTNIDTINNLRSFYGYRFSKEGRVMEAHWIRYYLFTTQTLNLRMQIVLFRRYIILVNPFLHPLKVAKVFVRLVNQIVKKCLQ